MDEIARFLHEHPPFSLLTREQLADFAGQIQIEYFGSGVDILIHNGEPSDYLYIIRRGSVDMLREDAQGIRVFETLSEGEIFGYPSMFHRQPPLFTVRTREEVLTYLLPPKTFHALYDEFEVVNRFFTASTLERLGTALQKHHERDQVMTELFRLQMSDLQHTLLTVAPDTTVRETAMLMQEHDSTCAVVMTEPLGIVSDQDLRNRVLAAGRADTTPIAAIMTAPIITMPSDSLAFEGLMTMVERRIHHIPITRNNELVGMVTQADLLRQQSRSPLLLPRLLERTTTTADFQHYTGQVEATALSMLRSGARVSDIGRVVAIAHDALLERILQRAEEQLGQPPCPYAWLVLGSEGRYEQTLRTDQDNALVYADNAPAAAETYFEELAHIAVDMLVTCGFPPCPGDIMATNPRWRQPLRVWQSYFDTWIARPDDESLLHATIFFDYRSVYGALDVDQALRPVIERGKGQRIFLGRMARNALRQRPPLGFFRNFVLERDGEQRDLIDLKHRGVALIVDLARIYALEAGSPETNTLARLRAAAGIGTLSRDGSEQLAVAFELISLFRLRHQARLLEKGLAPNNLVQVSELTRLEQHDLKEALRAIGNVQKGAEYTFQTSAIF